MPPEFYEGADAFRFTLSECQCPYVSGPPFNDKRYWWFRGYYSLKYPE